jgi:hypothetical protein
VCQTVSRTNKETWKRMVMLGSCLSEGFYGRTDGNDNMCHGRMTSYCSLASFGKSFVHCLSFPVTRDSREVSEVDVIGDLSPKFEKWVDIDIRHSTMQNKIGVKHVHGLLPQWCLYSLPQDVHADDGGITSSL